MVENGWGDFLFYMHFKLNCLSNAIVSFKSFLNSFSEILESYSIPYPFKYRMTSNLCKESTSSSLLIGGNPYSSEDTPSGNIIDTQPDEELFDDVEGVWGSLGSYKGCFCFGNDILMCENIFIW